MNIIARVDENMLNDVRGRLEEFSSKAPAIITSALNRAVTNVASNVSKEVRKEYIVKASDIKSTLEKTKASKANMSAIVRSRGELIPLDRFKVSPRKVTPKRKTPIKVSVKKGGMKPTLKAFVGDIHGIKIFKRETKKRLPIMRLFGPSIPQMLKNEEIRTKINQDGQEMFYRRLQHGIDRVLASRTPPEQDPDTEPS